MEPEWWASNQDKFPYKQGHVPLWRMGSLCLGNGPCKRRNIPKRKKLLIELHVVEFYLVGNWLLAKQQCAYCLGIFSGNWKSANYFPIWVCVNMNKQYICFFFCLSHQILMREQSCCWLCWNVMFRQDQNQQNWWQCSKIVGFWLKHSCSSNVNQHPWIVCFCWKIWRCGFDDYTVLIQSRMIYLVGAACGFHYFWFQDTPKILKNDKLPSLVTVLYQFCYIYMLGNKAV